MNAIGQLLLYAFTGIAYLLLFATIASLIATGVLKIYYTSYWYPVIVAITLSLLGLIHTFVLKHISYSLAVNTGDVLLRNIGKSAVLLIATLLLAWTLFSTGVLKGSLF